VTEGEGQSSEYESNVYHVENEIKIRAAKIVRAAESLSHLVAELKEYLILNDFSSINESVSQRTSELDTNQKEILQEIQTLFENHKQTLLASID
jgi:mediator of RNA polymerase II transcription subunit 22